MSLRDLERIESDQQKIPKTLSGENPKYKTSTMAILNQSPKTEHRYAIGGSVFTPCGIICVYKIHVIFIHPKAS